MENLFVGVDISKDTFDCVILNERHEVISQHSVFDNNTKGLRAFIKGLKVFSSSSMNVCIEDTGRYGALFISELIAAGITLFVVNPLEIKRSSGLARGKSDKVDALRIASYAATFRHRLTPYTLPTDELLQLQAIMSQRDLFTKILVQCKNNLKSLQVLAKSTEVKKIITQAKKAVKENEAKIALFERMMMDLIKSDEELHKTFKKITQITGVGPITALKCIAETNNFKKFSSPRKFSCHCGLAPFKYQSGTSVNGKTRTSKLCNKSLKGILFKAAATAIYHDPELRSYYERKVNQGKHKLSVINAVANKIVLRIFAVALREEPFVKITP